jgi:hypothetical protein
VVSILMAAGDSGNVWSQVDWVSRGGVLGTLYHAAVNYA